MVCLSRRNREIVEEAGFTEQVNALAISYKRLDDVMEGILFAVSSNPEHFPLIPGTRLRFLNTSVYPDAPALRVYFTATEERVSLIAIEFCAEEIEPFLKYEE